MKYYNTQLSKVSSELNNYVQFMSVGEKIPVEAHPLEPFLPKGAKILMLGSFPPKRERWSMDFFYPNRQNDMWKLMGLLYHGDHEYFVTDGGKRYDKESIEQFCTSTGIALYDTACEVRRLKDNASDKFLEVVKNTDIAKLLAEIPECTAIVVTGQKAASVVVEQFGCQEPAVGNMTVLSIGDRHLHFWRMPSTSRAYPLALEKKAEFYRKMLEQESCL